MADVLSVVISVGADIPPLPGAWAGASEYSTWARQQGHDVMVFTDEKNKKITAIDIANAITPIIDAQTLSTLFIYYAGHGECYGIDEDYWLLKRTKGNVGDIIDVGDTVKLAKSSGIPRVVIIADACRSVGNSVDLGLKNLAMPILPYRKFEAVSVTIDRFWAAGPGTAALEVQDRLNAANSYGIFTRALMRALRGEVAKVQERDQDGKKMVVRPGKLRAFLQEVVETEAAALPKGYPQKPDCRPESELPMSLLGDVPVYKLSIDTSFSDGRPVVDPQISLYMHDGQAQWRPQGTQTGHHVEFQVPSGLVFKTEATKGGFQFQPETPLPMFEARENLVGRYTCVSGPPSYSTPPPSPLANSGRTIARFAITGIIDEAGRMHHEAPSAGVFRVVTSDPLTGSMSSELQEFLSKGQLPKPVATSGEGAALERRIAQEAQVHGREKFETQTGLTLLGYSPGAKPEVACSPGLLNEVFLDNGEWQIRGNHSGNAIIRIGVDHYAALPVFKDLIGAVRLQKADEKHPGVADLSYAPSGNSRFSYDLGALGYSGDLVSANARDELDTLQLIAAACVRNGFFEVTIDKSISLAERLRQLKHQNPVLGVFAAYAYHEAKQKDQIIDMIHWFIRKRQTVPFDLVMLAEYTIADIESFCDLEWGKDGTTQMRNELHAWISPSWPMLTQGWSYLPNKYLNQFPVIAEARRSLAPGLWTTVVGPAGAHLFTIVQEGALQWT